MFFGIIGILVSVLFMGGRDADNAALYRGELLVNAQAHHPGLSEAKSFGRAFDPRLSFVIETNGDWFSRCVHVFSGAILYIIDIR